VTAPARLPPPARAFLRAAGVRAVFAAIATAGGEARVNGGAVRNALLGEPIGDVDFSTTLEPAQTVAALEAAGLKAVPTGAAHGTITAVSGGRGFEVTTLRRDIETDGRRAVVRFGTDWRQDALRRDFTMNALYCDADGRLFDPAGGYGDLAARRVRFIGDPAQRIAEDHLRILRFFRFYAHYGKGRPDAEGLKACAAARSDIAALSAERVWQEVKKLLAAPDPGRALLWMRTSGVLSAALPETEGFGIDAFGGVLRAEREFALQADPLLRLMSILPPRLQAIGPLCDRLKLSRAERGRLEQFAGARETDAAIAEGEWRACLYHQADREALDRALIAWANEAVWNRDAAKLARLARLVRAAQAFVRPAFPLSGRDLLAAGAAPGPAIGETLARLETRWVDSGFVLTKAQLLEIAKS
jgi:tRNA nucleotidyltransferase/poly(A) polymerase